MIIYDNEIRITSVNSYILKHYSSGVRYFDPPLPPMDDLCVHLMPVLLPAETFFGWVLCSACHLYWNH